jgi:DNA-binding CsgD family transcriptional regulator
MLFWDGVVAGEPGKAAVLLDEYGRLMRHTDAAYRLLVVEDGLRLARARLCAHGKVDDDALQAMLARCIQPIAPRAGTVRLRRPSGKQGLIVTCFPVARQLRMVAPAEAAAIVTIVDPTAAPAPRAERIRLAFDVTRREAEMAAALLAGHSVESAAAAMEIGLPTARTYMRKLYEKTQAHGQTALLRLLSRIY